MEDGYVQTQEVIYETNKGTVHFWLSFVCAIYLFITDFTQAQCSGTASRTF